MTEHEIMVDGIRLHVVEAGSGPTLLLLHGLSASHVNWERTIPAFADRWRVVAPDLPGHGQSAKPDAPYTPDFYAGVIRSLGHTLGIDEAVVAGNSMGGRVAIELALTYPRWTRALVLVAPAGGFARGMGAVGRAIHAVASPRLMRLALPPMLARSFYDPSGPGYDERRRVLTALIEGQEFPAFAHAITRSLAGLLGSSRPALDALHQPVLVVWGENDRLVRPTASHLLAQSIRHAHAAALPHCGHLPMLEQPAEFNRILDDFLRAVVAAPLPGAKAAGGSAPCS